MNQRAIKKCHFKRTTFRIGDKNLFLLQKMTITIYSKLNGF